MTRTEFLQILKFGFFGLLTGGFEMNKIYADEIKESKYKKWVWMNPWRDITNEEYKRRFEKIKLSGIDAIIPSIYAGWAASYNSKHLPVSAPLMEQIVPIAKEMELEVHAWMWTMICNNDDILKKHPSWFAVNRNGNSTIETPAYVGYYRFMCPNNPGVQEFVSKTVSELSYYSDLDGIHLDYIRFPDVILAENLQSKYGIVQDKEYPEYDYCYCNYCRSEFKELTGININEIKYPDKNDSWREFRYNSVTKMVNNFLVPAAKKNDKFISAAVFPNWENVRQQWSKWNVDAVFPMLYSTYYNQDVSWIQAKIREGLNAINSSTKLYSGLLVDSYNPIEMSVSIKKSLESNADGVSLFAYHSLKEDHYKYLSQLFRQIKMK